MPDFLCEEMQDYLRMLYDQKSDERIFTISKSYLHHEMDRGVKETGLSKQAEMANKLSELKKGDNADVSKKS